MRKHAALIAIATIVLLTWRNYSLATQNATLTVERDIAATYAVACYRQTYKDI